VATVFGHFPLTLVSGPGAKARNSIGLVLVAGMTIGTLFTLYILPAIYMLIARDHRARSQAEPEPAVAPTTRAPPGRPLVDDRGAAYEARRPGEPGAADPSY
jgi:multidrug efflux pump